MTGNVEHTDVGAYALGLLEDDDRRAFEAHLIDCFSCTAELAELSGMSELLASVPPQTVESELTRPPSGPPGSSDKPAPVIDLMRRRANADRKRSHRNLGLMVAAGVVLLAGGGVIGGIVGPNHREMGPAEHLVMMGENYTHTDGSTNIAGTIGLESKGWGTHVALKLEGVRGPIGECTLFAVNKKGEREVITNWGVPKAGYGVPGSPGPLFVHGGTAWKKEDIKEFEVDVKGGGKLVTIPI